MIHLFAEPATRPSGSRACAGGRLLPLIVCGILFLFLLSACGSAGRDSEDLTPSPSAGTSQAQPIETAPTDGTPAVPPVDLSLFAEEVAVEPLPLRAGFPFTITAVIHNNQDAPIADVPVMFYISARQEEIGYQPFIEILTITLPATQSVEVSVPVAWNFPGGEHQLWVQVNRMPEAWQARVPSRPEADIADNMVLQDLMIDPFDAYASELCSGRVDVEIGPADVLPEPDRQRVLVRVHNQGNRAVYNLPVVVLGDELSGIDYSPAIPPCGGTSAVYVEVSRPLREGDSLNVMVNPRDWPGGLTEDDFDNNQVAIAAGTAPGMEMPPGGGTADYDFALDSQSIEVPETWIVLVTVQNMGTRDAADVPIRIQNEAGRKINDVIPLVQGNGLGVAAFPVGYLWTRGGTLTFIVNPEDAKGAYLEINRDNNTATFVLP